MVYSITTPVILGLILLVPYLFFSKPKLPKGWNTTPLNSTLPRLRLLHPWRTRTKQSCEIVSLRIYPIKSCRGFEVQSTTLKEHGLDLDRKWMLVDASTNEFLTIRQIPSMTRIITALSSDPDPDLLISIPTTKSRSKTIRIPAHPSKDWLAKNTSIAPVKIWDNDTDGYIYREKINAPFSAFLGRPVSLVYKGPTPRVLKGNGAPELLGRVQSTGFPDVFPILIASEASLAELNARLRKIDADPVTVERFRPNIVVRGQMPWVEDSWKTVRIVRSAAGNDVSSALMPLDLDVVARCARCQVPNVDPETADKHKKQPWDTLISYRRVDEGIRWKPCFGMLGAPRDEGLIEVGMKLEVLEETNEHRYITGFNA
ncbi:MOSC N-terminal beta barrel [Penicillium manginii]|uniref:MOSC N-terminal beta barrel n=1 Tax=Penicillium manginii TaxID=203109 RepID=UPI00254933C2|nr:MOSC N-terminal beta barrel [Penicillium manginii]KAJ5739919.1 MOSC N-terminal beta barrel [Penicillium manginii]